jgi:NADPH-dependent curcumin reductase CurA
VSFFSTFLRFGRFRLLKLGTTTIYQNLGKLVALRLSINGFVVSDLVKKHGAKVFYDEMPKLVAEGKIKYKEHISKGIENAETAFAQLFHGDNFGKAVIVVANN